MFNTLICKEREHQHQQHYRMDEILRNIDVKGCGWNSSERSFRPENDERMQELMEAISVRNPIPLKSLTIHLDYTAMPIGMVNSSIEELTLTATDVEDLEEFLGCLKSAEKSVLKKLDISGCYLGDEIAEIMGPILCSNNTSLEKLILCDNDISTDGAIVLAQALRVNSTLTLLDLRENCVGEEGGGAIAAALQHDNTTLQTLLLAHNEMGFGSSMSALNTMIRPWEFNSEAAAADNNFYDEYSESEFLNHSDLDNDDSHDDDNDDDSDSESQQQQMYSMAAFGTMLKCNTTLKRLDLGGNDDLISSCAIAIANGLRENTALEELILDANPINTDGIIAIAQAVRLNSTLLTLSLEGIMFDREAVYQFADALQSNNATQLRDLNLNKNMIETTGAQRLAEALETNTTLRRLRLQHNDINDEGVMALSRVLSVHNTSLETLELDVNQMTDEAAIYMASRLPHFMGLQRLTLSGNIRCTLASNEALVEHGLRGNTTLTHLELPISADDNADSTVRHLTLMNRAGRRLLREATTPIALWSLVFERWSQRKATNRHEDINGLYHLIRELPTLLSR